MRPSSPSGWEAVSAAYAAVKLFDPGEQLPATAWAVVAVLSAMRERERLKDAPEGKPAFDRTCDDTLAYLQHEIEALRFNKAQ